MGDQRSTRQLAGMNTPRPWKFEMLQNIALHSPAFHPPWVWEDRQPCELPNESPSSMTIAIIVKLCLSNQLQQLEEMLAPGSRRLAMTTAIDIPLKLLQPVQHTKATSEHHFLPALTPARMESTHATASRATLGSVETTNSARGEAIYPKRQQISFGPGLWLICPTHTPQRTRSRI